MLNFFQKRINLYHNGNIFYTGFYGLVLTSETPNSYKEDITWENLGEYFRKGRLPFSTYYDRKKGKIFSYGDKLFDDEYFSTKEWEEPLNIQIEYDFLPINPSIKEIMEYPDGEKAIQYLIERGLSIVGK